MLGWDGVMVVTTLKYLPITALSTFHNQFIVTLYITAAIAKSFPHLSFILLKLRQKIKQKQIEMLIPYRIKLQLDL